MKRIILALFIVTVGSAAFQITYNIPNKIALPMFAAFTAQQDSFITIQVQGSQGAGNPDVEDYSLTFSFRTLPRDPNDNNELFVKKMGGRILQAFSLAHEQKLLIDIQDTYTANAPSIDVNEPNGIE
jgi:hypothetical protein